MKLPIEAYHQLVPEMIEVLQERYRVLNFIKMLGPIGRRTLGETANLSERETRTILEFLRNQQLVHIARNGATVTDEGARLLTDLGQSIQQWSGSDILEQQLRKKLDIHQVVIVSGDADQHDFVKNLLGLKVAELLTTTLKEARTIAVSGGSTVARIPDYLKVTVGNEAQLFIAARGGVGGRIELQANVIAASFSKVCDAKYQSFYYPEALSEELLQAFQKEPSVQKMLALYEKVDCLIHGIGEANHMAKVRETAPEKMEELLRLGAKGEAFGYYFDANGKAVKRIRTIGLQLEQVQKIPYIYAVAGGKSKAAAILSYMKSAPSQTVLITDSAAAKEILNQ